MQVMGTAPKSSGGPVNALDRRAKRWQYETFQYLEPIRRSCLYPGPDILYSFDRALMSVKADVYFSSVTRETGVGIQGSNASKATVAGQANLAGNKIRSSTHSSPSALGQNIKLSVQALASLSVDRGMGYVSWQAVASLPLGQRKVQIGSLAGPEHCSFPEEHYRNIAKLRTLGFGQTCSHFTQSRHVSLCLKGEQTELTRII